MPGYTPNEPDGDNAFLEWAKRVHQRAHVERKILKAPNALTIHTTQGVIHRPKPHAKTVGGGGDLPVWL